MSLKALRERRGLTQEDLADKAGISREYLARLETGRQDPRVSVLVSLARALATTLDELVAKGEGRDHAMRGPTTRNFEDALTAIFSTAQGAGRSSAEVRAGDLHRRVGGYPSRTGNHRMPLCCRVMRQAMEEGDEVLHEPTKGQGARLTIRYRLPR